MAIVATGYVRLQVLSNTLGSNIKKAVEDSFKDVDADLKKTGEKAGDEIADGVADGLDNNKDVDSSARDLGERVRDNVVQGTERGFGSKLGAVFRKVFKGSGQGIEEEIAQIGNQAAMSATDAAKKIFQSLTQILSGTAQALAGFAKGALIFAAPSIASGLGGMAAALVTSIVPAVEYLGGAGASGLSIGASAFLSMATSAGMLSFALKNAGDEMKPLTEKTEALKKEFAKPIVKGFLPGATEAVDNLRAALPYLNDQLFNLGQAWGHVAVNLSGTLTRLDNLDRINSILETNNSFTEKFGVALGHLTTSFLILFKAAKPFIDYVGDGLVKFSEWVETTLAAKEASGELGQTVDKMLEKWKQLWETIKDFGKGIFNIFKAASPVAGQFGDALGRIAEKFRAWTDKPENQERMSAFFQKMYDLAGPIAGLVGDIGLQLGHWLENLDTQPIKDAITTIRTELLPAIVSIIQQVSDAMGPELQDTLTNISGGFKKIADSGIIKTVAEHVGTLTTKLSELFNSDAGSKIGAIALALGPLAGAIGGVGVALGGVGGILRSVFYGLKIGQILGLGGGAGAGAGAGAGGGLASKILGVAGTVGGVILALEVLRHFSDALDLKLDDVYETAKNALDVGLSFLATGVATWLGVASGDVQTIADAAVELANKFPGLTLGIQAIIDNITHLGQVAGTATVVGGGGPGGRFKAQFDEFIKNVDEGVQGLGASLGAGKAAILQDFRDFSSAIDAIPLVGPNGELTGFGALKDSLATSFTSLSLEIATGGPNVGAKIAELREKINQIPPGDPVLEPLRQQMQTQLGNIEREVAISKAPEAFTTLMSNIQSSTLAIGDPLKPLQDNIFKGLGDLVAGIETRSPEVPAMVQNMLSMLSQIQPGSPLQGVKDTIIQQLQAMGFDVSAALAEIPPVVDAGASATTGAVNAFGNVISGAFTQAQQQAVQALKGFTTAFRIEHPDLASQFAPVIQSVETGIAGVVTALQTGSSELPGKVSALVQTLNQLPPGAPFDKLRQDITTQLTAAGVDITNFAPQVTTALGTVGAAAQAGGGGVGRMMSAGLTAGQIAAVQAMAGMNTGVANEAGKLPGQITPLAPAVTSAVTTMTAGVPTAGTTPFVDLNTMAASTAAQLPGAVQPGLASAVGQVSTSLAPVPTTGNDPFTQMVAGAGATTSTLPGAVAPGLGAAATQVGTSLAPVPKEGTDPFSQLGTNLAQTTGKYPGQIQPGLDDAAGQPASQFASIEQSGLAPWLSMSAAVVGAMNNMNISVARVLVAVAGLVVSSWSIIGQANASGLAGTVSTLNLTIAAANASGLAAQKVANDAIKITGLIIDMAKAVIQSQQMLKTVQDNASAAAAAVVSASQAASQAAQSAAAAAASRAAAAAAPPPVPARYGGTFDPVPGGTLTLIAEAGRAERVEPLDRHGLSARDRAMIDYLAGASGASPSMRTQDGVNVQVFIGERELTDIVDSRINQANTTLTRSLLSGRRMVTT